MYKKIIIDGTETNYSVSDSGEIRNDITGKFLKVTDKGTVQIKVNGKGTNRRVARIVATAFIPNPNNYEYVIYINGDSTDNRIENLKWISKEENGQRTWAKRRENGTTCAGAIREKKKRENIVETDFIILNNEKQIELDGELIPYGISTDGKVRNLKKGNYLKGSILHSYQYINFRWNGNNKNKAVHQLVASAFIPNPNNYTIVDHINGDRLDNRVENLRWVSSKENANNIHLDKTPKRPCFPEVIFSEEELKNEIWKDFLDYKVSNLGRVKGKKGQILKGTKPDCGYIAYTLNKKSYLGHILVWTVFNGKKPEDKVINHINGNKHDNRLINLELTTHQENMKKAAEETNAWNFREVGEFDDNNNLLRKFANASVAAREIGIQPGSMRNTIKRNGKCHNGLKYRYL